MANSIDYDIIKYHKSLMVRVRDAWLKVTPSVTGAMGLYDAKDFKYNSFMYNNINFIGICKLTSILAETGEITFSERKIIRAILDEYRDKFLIVPKNKLYWFVTPEIDHGKAYCDRLNFLNDIIEDYNKNDMNVTGCSCKENQWCKDCYHHKRNFFIANKIKWNIIL